MTMADTVAVMNEGVIEQMGPPTDLYESPKTAFVANFLASPTCSRPRSSNCPAKTSSSRTSTAVHHAHEPRLGP